MEKPKSLSVKDFLIRKMSVKMMMSEKVLDAVVSHQFSSANAAMKDNDSLEISGFGKFFFNVKKAQKLMDKFESQKALFSSKLEDPNLSEKKRASLELKLQIALDNIKDLKPKLDVVRNLRGMEEQPAAPREIEEGDHADLETEAGDL